MDHAATTDHLASIDHHAIARIRAAADANGTIHVQDPQHGNRRIPVNDAVAQFTDAMRPVPGFVGGGSWRISTRTDGVEWIAVEDYTGATCHYLLTPTH